MTKLINRTHLKASLIFLTTIKKVGGMISPPPQILQQEHKCLKNKKAQYPQKNQDYNI